MPVTYQGMDCLTDMESDAYMADYTLSQTEIPWGSNPVYGYYTVYYGCAIVFVAFLKHIYYSYRDSSYKKTQKSNYFTGFIDVITSYLRFFSYKRINAKLSYYTSLPSSSGSTLFILGSTLYLSLWAFLPHFWYRGCRGFGSPPLAVRTGIMATALTPFIYILAGKSNFVTFVTGISYEKLNYIHQYIGVMALILSLVHTIPFIYQDYAEGGSSNVHLSFRTEFAYYSGIPPLILLIFLCTLSKAWVRKRMYEAFWHSHWMLGIGYFATLTWHAWGTLGTTNYMWSALAFWGFQVLYRIIVKTSFKPNSLFLRPRKAQIFKLPGSQALQINVANNNIKWKPGQHVYLRFTSRLLDNHPFSVVNLPNTEEKELKFIVIPKKGLTHQLYKEIENNTSDVTQKNVYLDGPYGGCSRDHHSFEKVVLMATGSGITATLSFLIDLVNQVKAGTNKVTKEVEFIWIVREYDDIEWVKTELNQCSESPIVNINIYVAGGYPVSNSSVDEKSDKLETEKIESNISNEKSIEKSGDNFGIHFYKPIIEELLLPIKYSLQTRNFFVSSGSSSMKFAVSSTIASFQPLIFNNDIHGTPVEEIFLHTESFSW